MQAGWTRVAFHGAAAAVFFFAMQSLVIGAGTGTSLLWAVVGAALAAGLAWMQNKRNSGK